MEHSTHKTGQAVFEFIPERQMIYVRIVSRVSVLFGPSVKRFSGEHYDEWSEE